MPNLNSVYSIIKTFSLEYKFFPPFKILEETKIGYFLRHEVVFYAPLGIFTELVLLTELLRPIIGKPIGSTIALDDSMGVKNLIYIIY